MKLDYEILTRSDIRDESSGPPQPGADEVGLMPRECWDLVRTAPEAPGDFPVAVSAFADGRRVASAALVPHPVVRRGQEIACLWDYSLYSHPKAQALGLGGLMLRRLLKVLKTRGLPLAAYGSTPQADALYKALGMAHVGQAPRYVLPLSTAPILRRRLTSRTAVAVLSALPDLALRSRARFLLRTHRHAKRDFTLAERREFDDASIATAEADDGRVHLKRTAAWLNWKIRYARAIDGADIRAYVVSDRSGRPAAQFVARIAVHKVLGSQQFRDVRLFRVLDFHAAETAAAAPGLAFLVRAAMSLGAEVVEIVSSDRTVGTLCRSAGFMRSNGYDLYLGAGADLARIPIEEWALTMLPAEASFY